MAKRVAISKLNATTLDILNVIRENASADYRNRVPEISDIKDLPKVGDVIYGYPALANEFVSALINRIALVRVKSANFNNMYADLKKGYLEFGEVVEEVFVNLAKAREFSVAKAEERELKRVLPDVRSAFHAMNYKVQYPVTIQNEDIRMAFTREDGVLDLIAKIVDAMYTANEYDEFLMFKYLIIKAVAKGKMFPVGFNGSDIRNAAKAFRGISNNLEFINTKYNASGVHTNTKRENQQIFMDSAFNATYDVDVLASAFNMDKATFMGRLRLIDDFTTFDSERFSEIMENSDFIEPVTAEELALMANVKAILVDDEWFQFYDNLTMFTEKYVASGIYWNYFLNVWKTISSSPFSNAICFVDTSVSGSTALPATYTATVTDKSVSDMGTILTIDVNDVTATNGGNVTFIQTDEATVAGIAVHKYGAYIINPNAYGESVGVVIKVGDTYYGNTVSKISNETALGATITLSPLDSFNMVGAEAATGSMFTVAVSDLQTGVSVGTNKITGTLKFLDGENPITAVWGEGNFLAIQFTSDDWTQYSSVRVGLDPSAGTGLVELINDPDKNGIFKITNKDTQKLVVVATNGAETLETRYSLKDLVCQTE